MKIPAEKPFGYGMYVIEHEKMGIHELYLAPIAGIGKGLHYQMAINRLDR